MPEENKPTEPTEAASSCAETCSAPGPESPTQGVEASPPPETSEDTPVEQAAEGAKEDPPKDNPDGGDKAPEPAPAAN